MEGRIKMETKKCEYCSNQISYDKIRCENCNLIWNEGVKFGKGEVTQKLNNLLKDFMIIINGGNKKK